MTLNIRVTERGAVPRRLRKVYTNAAAVAWKSAGTLFHSDMRDNRFTEEHARKARYITRSPKYQKQKERRWGHTRPLEFSGETRNAVSLVKMSSFGGKSKGIRLAYPGARKLNFRGKGSQIRMSEEFRRLIVSEKRQLAEQFDKTLGKEMNSDQTVSTEIV